MAITAQELITRAYVLSGAVSSGDTPTAEELNDGLNALNEMLTNWAEEHISVYFQDTYSVPIAAGTNSVTIGPTGDFVAERPLNINTSWLDDSNDQSYPFEMIDSGEYARISLKTDTGRPTRGWYNPTYPNGSIVFDKFAELPYTLRLICVTDFDEFTTLSTESVLPTAYTRALRFNLAVELGGELGSPLDPRVLGVASDSYRLLKNANLHRRTKTLTVDDALVSPGRYDIASDRW